MVNESAIKPKSIVVSMAYMEPLGVFAGFPVMRVLILSIGLRRKDKMGIDFVAKCSLWSISPNAIPPIVVAIISLYEGVSVSAKSSHVALPVMVTKADSQKGRLFAAPAI